MSGTKVHSNYEDLLTFTRASKGHALRPVSYGTEIIQNGTYDSDLTGWDDDSIGSGTATVSSGQVSLTRVDASNRGGISQSHTLVSGKIYLLSFELVSGAVQAKYKGGSGSASQYFNNEDWNQLTTAGIYQTRFVATGTDGDIVFLAINNGVTAVLDNVSVKEVTFDESDGTLTLFEHPNNVPRVEWDADRNRLGLLVEESRTNLLPYSEAFDNAAWTKTNTSVTSGFTSPTGQTDGYKLTVTGATDSVVDAVTVTSGATVTYSVYVKKVDHDWVRLTFLNGANEVQGWFNLETGAIGTTRATGTGVLTSSSMASVGNGWYRISLTGSIPSATSYSIYNTTAVSDFSFTRVTGSRLVYGAQVEAGSFPTSYIKTTGSTVTRSADVASIPVADFGYNFNAGTLVITTKVQNDDLTDAQIPVFIGLNPAATVSNSYLFFIDGKYRVRNSAGATQAFIDAGVFSNSQLTKATFTYKANDFAASIDGGTVVTDTSGTVVESVETLSISPKPAGTRQGQYVQSIQYYPRRLTNAQLQALTEPRSTPTLSLTFDGLESSYTENYIHG